MKRVRSCMIAALLVLLARTARASALGEENLTLGSILAENIKQTADISATLKNIRSLTEEASDIANFANAAVKSVNNVRLLISDPVEFSRYTLRSWAAAYPEIRDIYAHTIDIRMAVEELKDPAFYENYDPYAYVRAFDALQNIEIGAYEIAIRAADRWNIVGSHDPALKVIEAQHKMAFETFEEVADALNRDGLSPQQATALAAKSSAISGLAAVEAAYTLEKMVGHQEVVFTVQQDSAESDLTKMNSMEIEAVQIGMGWRRRPEKGSQQ
jgi:hypothetical protein